MKSNLDQKTSVLELGCETGANLEKIQILNLDFKSYIGVDITPKMLDKAKRKFPENPSVTFVQDDLSDFINTEINNDNTYDMILCVWVLSHLNNQAKIINQVQKILSKNGQIFFNAGPFE